MESHFESDAFAALLGVQRIENDIDYAKCELVIKPHHKNALGTVHGGLLFALADVAYAVACNSEQAAIGMQADIRFLNQAKGKKLIAEASLVEKSKRTGHYQVIITDDENTLVAKFAGLAYRFEPR